jgi:hypothetical protein
LIPKRKRKKKKKKRKKRKKRKKKKEKRKKRKRKKKKKEKKKQYKGVGCRVARSQAILAKSTKKLLLKKCSSFLGVSKNEDKKGVSKRNGERNKKKGKKSKKVLQPGKQERGRKKKRVFF